MKSTNRSKDSHIDSMDLQVIKTVQEAPAGSFQDWAAALDISANTAARRFHRLERLGILRVIGRTLPTFGGSLSWLIRVQSTSPLLASLGQEFAAVPGSRWVRLSLDRRELVCGLIADADTLDRLLTLGHKRLPHADMTAHQLLHVWGQTGAVTMPSEPLDATDREILNVLAINGRTSNAVLARSIGIEATTISRRRKRLLESGVLYYEAEIDTQIYSRGNDANLWIRATPGHIMELGSYLRGLPEVNFLAAASGNQSLMAHVVLPYSAAEPSVSLIEFVDQLEGRGLTNIEIVPMGITMKRYEK